MRHPSRDDNPWRAAGLVGAIGADIAICTVLGYLVGRYLAGLFGGGAGWMLAGVLVGFFLGIFSVVLLLKKFLEDNHE